ncbi:MAG: hypothetical protein ACTHMB_04145, partial [Candidatus Binatia bacterium]
SDISRRFFGPFADRKSPAEGNLLNRLVFFSPIDGIRRARLNHQDFLEVIHGRIAITQAGP